jgi:hypothetical protein
LGAKQSSHRAEQKPKRLRKHEGGDEKEGQRSRKRRDIVYERGEKKGRKKNEKRGANQEVGESENQ